MRQKISKNGQNAILDNRGNSGFQLTALKYDYSPYFMIPEHFHPEAQLIFSISGSMDILVSHRRWLVPPQMALWMPSSTAHSIKMSKSVSMRTLYFSPEISKQMSSSCKVLHVVPLLKQLVLYCCETKQLSIEDTEQRSLIEVILSQISKAQELPLNLLLPKDLRGIKLAQILLDDLGDQKNLTEHCQNIGASKKTLERIFVAETGLNLGKWRQQSRLLNGIKLISEGHSITQASLDSGYSSSSAFSFMFKKILGISPSQYSKLNLSET